MEPEIAIRFTFTDILLSSIYTSIIFAIYWFARIKNRDLTYYNYYLPGLSLKLIGTLFFSFVYVYYYKDGDALNYFYSSKILGGLLFKDPLSFCKIFFLGDVSFENLDKFDTRFLLPMYLTDKFTFFFVRLITPLNLISFGNFFTCSVLLAAITYTGVWKLYTVFCRQFQGSEKQMAIAILFIPSVVFWGSGLLKDTVTISALGWFIYAMHSLMNKRTIRPFGYLLISGYLLFSIKPYILYAIIGASSVWFASYYLKKIIIPLERLIYAPIVISFFAAISLFLVFQISKKQERFSVAGKEGEFIPKQATSNAKSTFYREPINDSYLSALKSVPANINLTLFRPYVWETNGILSIGAAIESLLLLQFLILLLVRYKIIHLLPQLFKDPFLVFSLSFILILSFIVGFSTDNFGTLDRFRIPVLPFYVAICFILYKQSKDKKKQAV
jgi:hypothetical protein